MDEGGVPTNFFTGGPTEELQIRSWSREFCRLRRSESKK